MPFDSILPGSEFSPTDVNNMAVAYEAALTLLKINNHEADPLCELLARKVIDIARKGERDPAHICALALSELNVEVPD